MSLHIRMEGGSDNLRALVVGLRDTARLLGTIPSAPEPISDDRLGYFCPV
jgi:hypothetical protein